VIHGSAGSQSSSLPDWDVLSASLQHPKQK
jgi:hypothetical protein